jgi:hypothetical protein
MSLSCPIRDSGCTEGCLRVSYQQVHHGHELGRALEIDRSTLRPVRDSDFSYITPRDGVILLRCYNICTSLRLIPKYS